MTNNEGWQPDGHPFHPGMSWPGDRESGISNPGPGTATAAPVFNPDAVDDLEALFAEDQERMRQAAANAKAKTFDDPADDYPAVPPQQSAYAQALAQHQDEPAQEKPFLYRHRKVLGGIVAAGLALGIGGAAISQMASGDHPSAQHVQAASARLTRAAPPGWSGTPSWTHSASVVSNVAVHGNTLAYLSATGSLVVMSQDGHQIASSAPTSFTQGTVVGIANTDGGQRVAVASQGSDISIWPAGGGAAHQVSIPSGASTSWGSGSMLVSKGSQGWTVKPDGSLNPISVPSGYTPMGILDDGTAIVAKPGSAWKLLQGGKPHDVSVKPPPGIKGGLTVAWTSNGVMVAWGQTKDSSKRVVAFYDVRSGKMLASSQVATSDVNKGLPLAVSADATRASAGGLLADLKTGKTQYVNGWQALSADDDALYGSVNNSNKVWSGGNGEPSTLAPNTAIPWGVTANGRSIVVDLNSENQQSLAALAANGK